MEPVDFEQWKVNIENIPTKDVKLPNPPIDDFVASTETLAVDASEDRDVLAGSGLDVTLIDDLTPLSGALRYCQANWMSIFRAREEAQNQWAEQAPYAFEFKNELLHDFSSHYNC